MLLFYSFFVRAQLCGGSFGNPIFTEDFGSTGNTWQTLAPPLTAPAFTTYNYVSVYAPNDGQYTVANFSGHALWQWYNSADHTSDATGRSGNMLVVNADYNPGEFYRRRVSGLCSGQIYNFSAWILNIHRRGANLIKPNVTMEIRNVAGVVLSRVSTGELPEDEVPQWKEFKVEFQSDPNSDVIDVVMINNAPGGMGNDLAIDDITFRPCGPATSVQSSVEEVFTGGVCNNSASLQLNAAIESGTFSSPNYIWQKSSDNGITWQDLTPVTSNPALSVAGGSYNNGDLFRFVVGQGTNILSPNCRIFSAPLMVKINGYPQKPAATEFRFCKNSPSSTLHIPGQNILWYGSETGGSGSTMQPSFNTSIAGEAVFWVSQTVSGCESARSKVTIKIIENPLPPVAQNFSFCQNSTASPLNASGTGLKWYSSEYSVVPLTSAPVPDTSKAGTFFFWVTQTVDGCESPKTKVEVEILPKPFSTQLKNASICDGEELVLDVGEGFTKSVWKETGEDSRTFTVTKPGIYEVELTDINSCTAVQKVEITAGETPKVTVLAGDNWLQVSAVEGNPPYFYSLDKEKWQTQNIFENLKAGIYTVSVKSQTNSCTATAQTAVVFIPNVITPNGDGKNDRYFIQYLDHFPAAQFSIFNRFGAMVFSSASSKEKFWDGIYQGRLVASGTYWYHLDLGNGFVKSGWLLVKNR